MRVNLPVTQHDHDYPADTTLMSATDVHGTVTYANAAFIETSGYARSELLGQAHNLVRHPDMPREAFADLWGTLKARKSWTGLVKNRRKNGDHYWVRANVTPVIRQGSIAGYMSVRTKPAPQEVAQAEALYQAVREGRAGGKRFHQGLVVRSGWLAWTSLNKTVSVAARLRIAMATTGLAMGLGLCASGLVGPALWTMLGLLALTCCLTGAWMESQIARPLQQLQTQALAVASGQVCTLQAFDRVDEIGMILRAVNQAGLNIRALVHDVGGQVGGVHSASGEIAAGNNDLSARTEAAASSLQQTAASMEELTATVKNNADTAITAADLASSASQAAAHGGQVVSQVVGTMQAITVSSKRIADIISVIDGIAFQTNILALNAAVEAARAGEQGRGFAVVAGEVRSLASRSAAAAKEIGGLIHDSVSKVEDGEQLVHEAGRAMEGIVNQVHRVANLLTEISSATREQSSGIGQVTQAVNQLDQVTQQNAALVEESAAAAESLRDRASALVDAVNVYGGA